MIPHTPVDRLVAPDDGGRIRLPGIGESFIKPRTFRVTPVPLAPAAQPFSPKVELLVTAAERGCLRILARPIGPATRR